jgi:hypothetical protein
MAVTLFARNWSTLESTHGSAVAETMKRVARNEHFPYEQEHIAGDLRAVRVFLDGFTYRMGYAREGAHDHILLGPYLFQKKDRKLADARSAAGRTAAPGTAATGRPDLLVSVMTDGRSGLNLRKSGK